MSWSIDITSDRPITEAAAAAIVADLPKPLRGMFKTPPRNSWGWTAAVDIHAPDAARWRISGAGFSRPLAKPAADTLAECLRQQGHTVHVGARRD